MNLVINGDAESGPGGSAEPVDAVTGWVILQGAPALVDYSLGGGYPGPEDPGPPRRGSRFFSGGDAPRTALRQDVALPAEGPTGRAAVDAGGVRYAVSGWLGGYASQQDGVRLSVEFRDTAGSPLALSVLGPVTADERKGRTGMVRRAGEAAVPPGARSARLYLVFDRSGGTSNDGYADGLSLTLNAPNSDAAGGRS